MVRQEWESETPFDHEGDFYRVKGGWSSVRPATPIPVYFGGASEDAIRVGGKHADVYAFWGEPLEGIRERIRQVRAAAAPYGRDTTVQRQPPADRRRHRGGGLGPRRGDPGQDRAALGHHPTARSGSTARTPSARSGCSSTPPQGDVHDKRLWTAIAKVTGATGNSTALVGSYEQVAEALLDYVDLGVTTLLIRGFDPLADAYRYGRLISLVRAGAAGRRHRLRARLSTAARQKGTSMTSTLTQQDTTAQQDRRQVEILGMIGTRDASESRPGSGPAIDPDYTRRFARAHEEAGFDRVLIGYGSSWPEGTQVAAHVAAHTERLGLLVAHRPGFVAPDPGLPHLRHPRPVLAAAGSPCTSSPAATTPSSAATATTSTTTSATTAPTST